MSGSAEWYDRIASGLEPPPPQISLAIQDIGRLGYTESRDSYDWVPTTVAWRAYYERLKTLGREPVKLIEFAWAFHLAFPEAERCRRRRASDGKSLAGWAGVTGPGAERSVDSDQWKRRRKRG